MERLVDIDDDTFEQAKRRLGTTTVNDTVNAALRLAAGQSQTTVGWSQDPVDVSAALDALAALDVADRARAWR